MTGDRSRLRNFVKKFIGTVRFGNDHFGAIMGYGDYVIGESVISRVYYVEGLGHNLFFVGQFCDSDLEVAFRKHSCYVRDMDDVKLIKGYRGSNLYTILIEYMLKSSPIFLLSKASKNKSWLWHRRLNHLNFGTINDLARKYLVRGLPRLKFEKDQLCSAVFGALCYPTNDSEDLGKLQPIADIGIFVGYAPSRKGRLKSGALYSWEFLLKFHLHACELGSWSLVNIDILDKILISWFYGLDFVLTSEISTVALTWRNAESIRHGCDLVSPRLHGEAGSP
ncbi:integrase, catalytic region, zinc finger, CCHC-type containing protein [Tanacetum coccineum]